MSARRTILVGLALAVAVWVPSCSLVAPYPPVEREIGALCHDGLDDDLDGDFDCDDSECDDPACAEASEGQCSDGRDDDADGLVDLADPGCFWRARFDATRCTPVGPSEFEPSFGDVGVGVADTGWRLVAGAQPTLVADPSDPSVLAARTEEGGSLLVSEPLAGALVGASFHVELVAPHGQVTTAGIVVGDVLSAAPSGFQIFVVADGTVLLVGDGLVLFTFAHSASGDRHVSATLGVAAHVARDGTVLRPRMTADVFVDGRETMLDAPRATPFPGHEPGEVPDGMEDGLPWRAVFSSSAGGALLSSAHAHADAFDACVQDGSPPSSPVLPHPVIGLARAGDTLCAVTRDGPVGEPASAVARRSTDGGLHWDEGAPLVLAPADVGLASVGTSPVDVSDVALASSGTGVVGVAALSRAIDGHVVSLRLVRSADCVSWQTVPSGLDDALPSDLLARSVDYRVRDDGSHEISLIEAGALEGRLLLASSPDASEGSFRFALETTPLPPLGTWRAGVVDGVRVARIGSERVLFFGDPSGLRAIVQSADGTWSALDAPLIGPSGVVGALDATHLAYPITLLDPPTPGAPPSGLVAYAGTQTVGTCPDCDLGAIVTRFRIVPR